MKTISVFVRKIAWALSGRCTVCGEKLVDGGWYNEKMHCKTDHS